MRLPDRRVVGAPPPSHCCSVSLKPGSRQVCPLLARACPALNFLIPPRVEAVMSWKERWGSAECVCDCLGSPHQGVCSRPLSTVTAQGALTRSTTGWSHQARHHPQTSRCSTLPTFATGVATAPTAPRCPPRRHPSSFNCVPHVARRAISLAHAVRAAIGAQ
jgi:hypothetical protein